MAHQTQPLHESKTFLIFIGVCQPPENTPWHKRLQSILICLISLGLMAFALGTSIVYIVKYVMTDLENALYALFQVAAEFVGLTTLFASVIYSKRLTMLFDQFKVFYESCKYRNRFFFI